MTDDAVPASTTAAEPGGHIYVIEFSNGVVKVGSTRTLDSRLRKHVSDAAAFGLHVTNRWASERHRNYLTSEKTLIAYAKSRAGERFRQEYFKNISLTRLIDVAEDIARSNGEMGVVVVARSDHAFPLAEVHEMYPHLNLREIHRKCIHQQIPRELRNGEYLLSHDTIAALVRAHAEVDLPRSVRHRLERRAA